MLGLAMRAGKIASGGFKVEECVKNGKAHLVIIAQDASDNTKKMFQNMCSYYHVPIIFYSNRNDLGHTIGKEYRASLAVLDEGFVKSILTKLEDVGEQN